MQSDSNRLPVDRKLLTRFFSKIKIDPNMSYKGVPCWLWTGCINKVSKYSEFHFEGRTASGHRIAHALFVNADIPVKAHSDHLCRVRRCVNPAHLEIVSHRINCLRGVGAPAKNANKTHCPRGHPFSPNNTFRPTKQPTWRGCLTCKREQQRNKYIPRIKKVATHCKKGHALSLENTYTRPLTKGRRCRICRDAYMKTYRLST